MKAVRIPLLFALIAYYELTRTFIRSGNSKISLLSASLILTLSVAMSLFAYRQRQRPCTGKEQKRTEKNSFVISIAGNIAVFLILSFLYQNNYWKQQKIYHMYASDFKAANANTDYETEIDVVSENLLTEAGRLYTVQAESLDGLRLKLDLPVELLQGEKREDIAAGTLLRLNGKMSIPQNTFKFAEKDYLAGQGIYAKISVKKISKIQKRLPFYWRLKQAVYRLQNFHAAWYKLLAHSLSSADAGLLQAVCWAEGTYLSKDDKTAFKQAGIIHVLVASGQHAYLVLLVICLIVEAVNIRWGQRRILTTLILTLFACFYWTQVAFWRAVIQLCLAEVTKVCRRNYSKIKLLFYGNGLLLLWRPYLINNFSFHLSLTACLSIYLFLPYWQKIQNKKTEEEDYRKLREKDLTVTFSPYAVRDCLQPLFNKLIASLFCLACVQTVYSYCGLLESKLTLAFILGNIIILPQMTLLCLLFQMLSLIYLLLFVFCRQNLYFIPAIFQHLLHYLRLNLHWVNSFTLSLPERKYIIAAALVMLLFTYYRYYLKSTIRAEKDHWLRYLIITFGGLIFSLAFCA